MPLPRGERLPPAPDCSGAGVATIRLALNGDAPDPRGAVNPHSGVHPAATEAHIMKWDLAKHPVVTFYVDPSVPRAFWPAVVDGIRRWNTSFAAAGHARPFLRAVVPTEN